MHRRDFLASSVALAVSSIVARHAGAAASNPEVARARALYDAIFEEMLTVTPQSATTLGLDTGSRAALRSRLNDRSPDHRMGPLGPVAHAWPKLQAIDAAQLAGRDRSDFDTIVWLASISREIEAQPVGTVDGYTYPVPYVVSQLTGAYQSTPDFLATKHPLESSADAEAFLARLEAFARALNYDTARMRDDLRRGIVPPDFVVDKTLVQLKLLRAQPGAQSVMTRALVQRTAAKGIAGDWGGRAARLVDGPLAKALDAQIAAATEQRARATHDAGIRGRPGGELYYQLCLRYQTSTRLTPDEAHELGVAQVAEITAEADTLLKAQGHGEGTVGARLSALTKDPRWLYPNTDAGRAELLADLNRQIEAIKARLPELFAVLPRTPVEVRRVPPAIELGAPRGYAQFGSLDGTRPGAYYINLADTGIWPKWALPTLTYHESLPGHHLQGTLALESQDTPLLHRTLLMNAYTEGWAPVCGAARRRDRHVPRLPARATRHAAVVPVSRGAHRGGHRHALEGWSRERAVDYMEGAVGLARGAVESEIDRYCVWPGQACGYKIGHLEIVRLRAAAQAKLGERFDLHGFHDAVLKGGAMPLEVLARVVDDWMRSV